jgi:uracil-DNA glycosylase
LLNPEPRPTLDSLQAEVAACTKCSLCKTRTQTVFGSGNKQAEWMVIGEAPGQSEDQQGLPFVAMRAPLTNVKGDRLPGTAHTFTSKVQAPATANPSQTIDM